MNVTYDPHTDTLTIAFRETSIIESDEEKPGVILDYDEDGEIVRMEILDASRRVHDPRHIEFKAAG